MLRHREADTRHVHIMSSPHFSPRSFIAKRDFILCTSDILHSYF
jgi:hypothetical protein